MEVTFFQAHNLLRTYNEFIAFIPNEPTSLNESTNNDPEDSTFQDRVTISPEAREKQGQTVQAPEGSAFSTESSLESS